MTVLFSLEDAGSAPEGALARLTLPDDVDVLDVVKWADEYGFRVLAHDGGLWLFNAPSPSLFDEVADPGPVDVSTGDVL